MKKNFKIVLCLFLILTAYVPLNIKANENNYSSYIKEVQETNDGIEIILTLSEEEMQLLSREELDEIHRIAIENVTVNKVEATSNIQPYSRPTYFNVHGESQRKVFGGFAGNQPPGGNRFATGGSFYWLDSGGPSATVSVGLTGWDGLWKLISVSVSLGTSSSSGKIVDVPNTVDYFKLYIEKTYDCKPYITYCTDSFGVTTEYGRYVSKILFNQNQYAVKV